MAEINNFSEITENFDTIKTLLNSIRAQGILNTSDVDKLLSGINSKLEKLNTEEDIDLIKIFLSELKQNLDERHGVLVSKFGAIESLFSNLLKNSADMMKSSEIKELFDIIATNLSVFSREVVSQKENLNDIALRLDAMRSDDSQKKDIIKNISVLKTDIEHLSNGFDSIVLSLNENFKTLIKTISSIDQTEVISKFGSEIADILNSSNTILSAIQMLDKKSLQVEDAMRNLATQDDIISAKKWLSDLVTKNHELATNIDNLADKYYKIDNLADKIDASVNIIAGLKTIIADKDTEQAQLITEELNKLDAVVRNVTSNESFEEFKSTLEPVLKEILDSSSYLKEVVLDSASEIKKISTNLQALNIQVNFENLTSNLSKVEHDIKGHVDFTADKISQLTEVSTTRTINEITSNTETLGSKLSETQYVISTLCEKNFNQVVDNIKSLKDVITQIDENNVSGNNAIFSNITDRLAIFENSLKNSLDRQEEYVSSSAGQLIEHLTNLKEQSGVMDYKLDSTIIEIGNSKREYSELKNAVQNLLSLDFVNIVKDLKVELYASKQDVTSAIETSAIEISEKMSNDLFGKYELLISKLDSTEDEIKNAQSVSLNGLKGILDNISSSIMDVLSYVSARNEIDTESIDNKLANITEIVKESNLNYVESVRDVVEVIRTQVENNLIQIQNETSKQIDSINSSISKNTDALRNEIKYSYNKLLEVQENFDEIKETLSVNNSSLNTNINDILASATGLKKDFDTKLSVLKNALLDKISEFKQDFTCENADKISEIKFTSENLHSKSVQHSFDLKNELKGEIAQLIGSLKLNIEELSEQVAGTTLKVESSNRDVISYIKNDLSDEVSSLGSSVKDLAEKTTSNLTSTLAQILDNFVALKAVINSSDEKIAQDLQNSVNEITEDFAKLSEKIVEVDNNIDADLTNQLTILERNFETLNNRIDAIFEENGEQLEKSLGSIVERNFAEISGKMEVNVANKLEDYKAKVESLFTDISEKTNSQAELIKEQVLELNTILNTSIEAQNNQNSEQLKEIANNLKSVLDENIEITAKDYELLRNKLETFADAIKNTNQNLVNDIKSQFDDVTKFVDSGLEIQAQEVNSKFVEIDSNVQKVASSIVELNSSVSNKVEHINENLENKLEAFIKSNEQISADELVSIEVFINRIIEQIELTKQNSITCKDLIIGVLKEEFNAVANNIEKETDVLVKDLIEQFELMRADQKDELSNLAVHIESSVEDYIYNHVNDLKSYLDIKTDSSVLNHKIDNLTNELNSSVDDVLQNVEKLLEASVFTSAVSDIKTANEILITSMSEKLNRQIQDFVQENVTQKLDEKLNLFDKKFVDTLVDKYEEIKLISNNYNDSFEEIQHSMNELLVKFVESKDEISQSMLSVVDGINHSIEGLSSSFADLKAQILNKSFDEAFQASMNNQISGIEELINKQFGYLEDISELCENNLPEIKDGIMQSISELSEKIGTNEGSIADELNKFKSDIITQFITVFNQVSFVAEQEEILDFIQEKHSDLITILSHIVNTVDGVETVKESVAVVDNKMDSLKEEFDIINEKINSIISSDEDINYVYSLQDLEADIANLRLVLNDMKEDNKSKEFDELISSTNDIYKLVETIKTEMPKFELEEFKRDFEALSEDIVSISTRTNKLILASDESYKTLQDNLQDFKLVINDLDERTRNFSQEVGMDRIENKLGAINSMIQSGAKTNQVFNQVFEYLAEWVDNAGAQITAISDKVETLDDIGQIKVMLEDLKAEAADNSETNELIEALGNVFDKQTKRISSLEAKLDRMIVETTINNKNNKLDMSPMENTLNSFLVAIDDKMSSQQAKINSLETKLEEVMSLIDPKDTVQLTKKVGGMDRQIAKLNKSIEKIASHVVEK